MIVEKTAISGPLFVLAASVTGILLFSLVWSGWRRYLERIDKAVHNFTNTARPLSPVLPTIGTLVLVITYIVGVTTSWSILQKKTTSISTYQNPAELAQQEKVLSTIPPTEKEMAEKRSEQKKESETKPHEEAQSAFDQSMKREAEKIRQRSGQQP